jgi:hypothetical protein
MRRVPARSTPGQKFPAPRQLSEQPLGDLRFRSLLSATEWERLPAAIRRRFSKRLAGGATAIYTGAIDSMRASRTGRFLAQAFRLIGAPLPIHMDVGVPSIVSVTEDMATGGQIWTRLYAQRGGFPQIIQSSKRFAGPTGLEEYIGFGITMALKAKATETALIFESAGYSLKLGPWRIPLPAILSPGNVTVTHEEMTEETFRFTLLLAHPLLGLLIAQSGLFHEAKAP